MTSPSFDPIWREKYAHGLAVRAPYDCIVSFVYRNLPAKERSKIRILEVGCGTGNNVWYLAREGFRLSGIDASPEAISYAQHRLDEDKVAADLRVADFTQLPYADNTFDLVFDRCALTNCGLSFARKAVCEVSRVLVPGGKFFINPYSSEHTSAKSGRLIDDNLTVDINGGSLVGCGQICFYNQAQLESLFPAPWQILSMEQLVITEVWAAKEIHAEWWGRALKQA
ncbi:MAG: class I SAM-dependent methyltransferase [Chthoniobacterales bacterium]